MSQVSHKIVDAAGQGEVGIDGLHAQGDTKPRLVLSIRGWCSTLQEKSLEQGVAASSSSTALATDLEPRNLLAITEPSQEERLKKTSSARTSGTPCDNDVFMYIVVQGWCSFGC